MRSNGEDSRRTKARIEAATDLDQTIQDEDAAIDAALKEAVRAALRRHKQLGESVVVFRDGKVIELPPEEIPVD